MTQMQITRMEARAIEQRWPVKAEYREGIIKRLMRVIADPNSSAREVTAASKAIMSAEAQNIADEHKELDRMDAGRNRILDLLTGSGAGPSIEVIEPGGKAITGGGDQSIPSGLPVGEDEGGGARGDSIEERGEPQEETGRRVNGRNPRTRRLRKKKKKGT